MYGPGCPIGSGGFVQQIRNDTPVFSFPEWGLTLPGPDGASDSVSKWCTEEISLANGPAGMQLRIATVDVSGWAVLDAETKLGFEVQTTLGGVHAGVSDYRYFQLLAQKEKKKNNNLDWVAIY
jgi:Domain of unknown function (DUF4360)